MVQIHEVFTNLGRANSHAEKAKALLDGDSLGLRTLMRLNFDPRIKLHVNEEIEYVEEDTQEYAGGFKTLHQVTRAYSSLTNQRMGKDYNTSQLVEILESLDPREAKLLHSAVNKDLKLRGLSKKLAVQVWGNRIFR